MKFFVSVFLIALLSFVMGLWLPWWSLAIVAFLIALLIPQHPAKSFFSAFIALFLLWAILAFWIDTKNEGLLSIKIANLLPLGGYSVLLMMVTAFIGALVAGMAAMSGSLLRAAVITRQQNSIQ